MSGERVRRWRFFGFGDCLFGCRSSSRGDLEVVLSPGNPGVWRVEHQCPDEWQPGEAGHGAAVDSVSFSPEGDRSWMIGNDEYWTSARYCPFCGMALPELTAGTLEIMHKEALVALAAVRKEISNEIREA